MDSIIYLALSGQLAYLISDTWLEARPSWPCPWSAGANGSHGSPWEGKRHIGNVEHGGRCPRRISGCAGERRGTGRGTRAPIHAEGCDGGLLTLPGDAGAVACRDQLCLGLRPYWGGSLRRILTHLKGISLSLQCGNDFSPQLSQ